MPHLPSANDAACLNGVVYAGPVPLCRADAAVVDGGEMRPGWENATLFYLEGHRAMQPISAIALSKQERRRGFAMSGSHAVADERRACGVHRSASFPDCHQTRGLAALPWEPSRACGAYARAAG